MAFAFAGKSVAASAISTIVRKSFNYLEKYMKAQGMKSVKERLERTLPQVQVVFDAVDTERIKDRSEALDAWLWQLRDAVEEAEDVLDEVEYYKFEKKAKSRGNKVSRSLYKCKRLFIQHFNTTLNVGTFKRMVDAMKKLDEVTVGVERFILLVERFDSSSLRHISHQEFGNSRETTSFLLDETIIGRDTQRDQIVEWLIKQDSDAQEIDDYNITTFAIVGIGGMGKTTIAQTVYHDQRVKQCFDKTLWVCVSNDFDVHTLTRKIIQEISERGTDVTSLNALQEILKGTLSSKKFLLVFDDVWNDESTAEWEKLLSPLKFGQKGSKILMTTRMQSVVDTVERALGARIESLKLQGLQENDLLMLFNKHAFFGVNPDDYINLQGIGKSIAKKLSGCPLAAKVMGGLLNSSMDTISWNRVLRGNIANIEYGTDGIMKVLKLSYQHLPSYLQACFRYCSLFPEDYCYRKDQLVTLWMGSGLIQPCIDQCQRPEDTAEYYLGILTRKSFLELRSSNESLNLIGNRNPGDFIYEYYVMHDLLHDLARKVSEEECMFISSNNYYNIPRSVRHLQIYMSSPLIIDFSPLMKLRTLFISFTRSVEETDQMLILSKVLKVATKLRVLVIDMPPPLQKWKKLPFDNLMHLRYLSTSSMWGNVRCPPFVYKLYHLQKIESYSCWLESGRLSNLVNLRYLNCSGTQTVCGAHIGKLTSLRNLRVNINYETMSELKELKDLHCLYISGIHYQNAEEAKLAKLSEKENLVELSLSWYYRPFESGTEEEYLDNLQPHKNLSKLKINGYSGSRSPFWMESPMISNLTNISISRCVKWRNLPPLGSLPSLKYLYLMQFYSVKRIDISFYGREEPKGFPSLKVLSIVLFPALEEWDETDGGAMFPQLTELFIVHCKKLGNLPALPSNLAYLEIDNAGLKNLPAIYQPSVPAMLQQLSLSKLKISCCPNLVKLNYQQYFFGLDELHIKNCENLLYFPTDQLQMLPFLKTFLVENCPKLIAPEEDIILPSSVRELFIGPCGAFETFLLKSLCHLTSLTTLQLHDCLIASLPSAEVFRNTITVQHLEIVNCRELTSLDGVQELTSLSELNINGCDKLDEYIGILSQQMSEASDLSQVAAVSPPHLGKLKKLRISSPLLLQWEPLGRVNSLTHLTIDKSHRCLPEDWLLQNRNQLKCLGVLNATHLEFLPSSMASFASLETLSIHGAVLLQSLPELPVSLEILQIFECHSVLERRCQKRKGCDWRKIERISNLQILQKRPASITLHYYTGVYRFS